ncbi:MAG: acetoacetate decarboxylase family protein [Candidatus Geothermincolia bacterium]
MYWAEKALDFLRGGLLKEAKMEGKLWENARFILADVPLDEAAAKAVLPLGMKLTQPAMGTVFISDYTKTAFTVPYHEAALLIHVKTPFGCGLHCCWMIVDDDTALILGRELLGYPKKLGSFEYSEDGDSLSASVSRRGVKVLTLEGTRGAAQSPAPPVFDVKTFNAGGINQAFAINPIWLLRPHEVIHESYEAEIKVTVGASEFDPLARLISGGAASGRFAVTDILGSKYMFPVGFAGPFWFSRVFNMRVK